jgi:hypothetical protein
MAEQDRGDVEVLSKSLYQFCFFDANVNLHFEMKILLQYQSIFEYRAIAIELEGNLRYQFSDKLLFKNNFKSPSLLSS